MSIDSGSRLPSRALFFLSLFFVTALLAVRTSAQSQAPLFPTNVYTPPVGNTASIATGDFNGDGQPDLAYISSPFSPPPGQNFSTLIVLLNQGGTNPPIPVTTSSLNNCASPTSLTVADMNNDKKLDVLLTCSNGYVAVLFGNGDGTFQNPAYYAVSNLQSLATPVDLNGDGYLDVAALSIVNGSPVNGSSVSVLLNQGGSAPGTFAAAKSYPSPSSFIGGSIGVGDFNGDGKQDVLVSTGGGLESLAVFYGNGDGTLKPAQTTSGGGYYFVTADLNHDGLTDVAYISSNGPGTPASLQTVLGSSGGGFVAGSSLPLNPSSTTRFPILVGSTNGGSNVNLAVLGDNTAIFLGDGNGGFTPGQTYALTGFPFAAETDSNGITSLVFLAPLGFTVLTGNGDGTFQGVPALYVGQSGGSVAQTGITGADVNGDGLTDMLAVDATGNLLTFLCRGNGTFSITSKIPAVVGEFVATGDFNADGRIDAAAIVSGPPDAKVNLYLGNGNGTFQPSLPAVDLQTTGAEQAVVGDFNGDSNLDLVVSYNTNMVSEGSGLVFLPGKGNGAFGTPVTFSQGSYSVANGELLAADLNNDKKLDLIWNGAVYLGNGDGTFRQMPLGLTGAPLAVADLNGDGIPDLVVENSIYAGNGDGTFQTAPFYTVTLSQNGQAVSASIGDVNAAGHLDLLVQYLTPANGIQVAVSLGDGKGNFIADTNIYYVANGYGVGSAGVLARLNNKAPALPDDTALDYLVFANSEAVSLLNQTNPTPAPPSPLPSSTTLVASATSAGENQQLIFTAAVTGIMPTGSVSFIAGSTTLGTAVLANGTATLPASFASAGTYAVTANYAGDGQNLASVSNAVSIAVAAPDFSVSASPAAATVTAGQSAVTTLTVTPLGGYSGTVSFSCGALPSGAACSFAPTAVTPANGTAVTSKLTISTTAPSTAMLRDVLPGPLQGIAWATLICFAFSPRRMLRWNRRIWNRRTMHSALLVLFLIGGLLSLSGCGSSSSSTKNPGTPTGTQNVTVTVADSAGKISHTVTFQVVVQ